MTSVRLQEIQQIMPHFSLRGTPREDLTIEKIATTQDADSASLVFVTNPKHLQAALSSQAPVVLTSEKILSAIPDLRTDKTLLLHPNPDMALATLIRKYFGRDIRKSAWWEGVHPSATVAPTAHLGAGVLVGPGAVVSAGCVIGENVYIGANAVLEENVRVGARTILHPQTFIGHHCMVGEECEILPHTTIGSDGYGYAHTAQGEHHRIPHLGRVIIGNRVDIGANCAIDRGTLQDTEIGDGTKMDNLCHVAHNCKIGKHCLITAHFIAAGSATIGNYVVIGGRTSVTGHIHIADQVHVAAHSAVTGTIDKPGQYGGHPIQPLQKHLKSTASIAALPEMRKQLSQLMKKVFPATDKDL